MITRNRIRLPDGSVVNRDVEHGGGPVRDSHTKLFRGQGVDYTIQNGDVWEMSPERANAKRQLNRSNGAGGRKVKRDRAWAEKDAEATIRASRGWGPSTDAGLLT